MTVYNESVSQWEQSKTNSRLRDWTLKTDSEIAIGEKHRTRFGTVCSIKYYAPEMSYIGSVNLNENVRDTTTGNVYSLETYLEDHWQLNDHWSVDAGVRFSLLAVPHARYYSLQPRLSISYRIGESVLFKTSWARMQQSQHLLTSNSMA